MSSSSFIAIKHIFWGRSNNFRDELRPRETTRKKINEIEKLEIEKQD